MPLARTPEKRRRPTASAELDGPAADTVTTAVAAATAYAADTASAEAVAATATDATADATVRYLITLTGLGPDAVTLTLPAPPDADDLAAIRAAAAPLLDLLAARHLTTPHRDRDQGD